MRTLTRIAVDVVGVGIAVLLCGLVIFGAHP